MEITIKDILGILIIYQSLVFIFSLLLDKKSKPYYSKILMSICIIITVHFVYMGFESYGIIKNVLLGPFFGLIYGPLYYTYTKSLIDASVTFKKIVLHFIPAVLALIFIFATGNALISKANLIGLVVIIHFTSYLVMALRTIYSYRRQLMNMTSSFYRISLNWLEIIIYLQLVTVVVMLLESYFQSIINTNNIILVIYILTLILIHCFYYLGLKQVRLFKGFKKEHNEAMVPKGYLIANDVFNDYLEKLTTYFEKEKPYLEYDITLQDIAEKLSISPRNLSYVINKGFKRNYYSFINHHRLELAKQYLLESDRPVKEIMYDSGFPNKATFHVTFKKNTGLTPVQFRERNKS